MKNLITSEYKSQNENLHKGGIFGVSGYKWAETVAWLSHRYGLRHVLDYGAGQQTLKKALEKYHHIEIKCYDPAVQELSFEPSPAELLTCTDVLEHIEPGYIDDVLNHIKSLTQKVVFLVIPTGPAAKVLPDGRNAHLIQKPVDWWLPKLLERFDLVSLNHQTDDIVFVGTPKVSEMLEVNNELLRYLEIMETSRLLSITFDGVTWNISAKSKRVIKRFLPRLISILNLGARSGVSIRVRGIAKIPYLTVTYY